MAQYLDALLRNLPARHRSALEWYRAHAGTEQSWPEPLMLDGEPTFLATRAKGIYKPGWLPYALSVRQSLGSSYADREPVVRPDHSWAYSYFQENPDPTARDEEFTNRALVSCWRDRVPVGVMRQVARKPAARYRVLGVALVAGWDGGYFFLEGFAPDGYGHDRGPGSEIEMLSRAGDEASPSFDPSTVIDARTRTVAAIICRRGQPEFRRRLLAAYGGRCAVTGCEAVEVLEAAHISPYRGPDTNSVDNGLLLRADIHTLFDLGLLAVDSATMTILVAPVLAGTTYGELSDRGLGLPSNLVEGPSSIALDAHRTWAAL